MGHSSGASPWSKAASRAQVGSAVRRTGVLVSGFFNVWKASGVSRYSGEAIGVRGYCSKIV
jgi:predicted metal-binding membrane protein